MSKPIVLDETNFDLNVLQAKVPVLVDFWAPWCHPCKMVAPIIDELAEEYTGKLVFGKINVDENHKIATKYDVMSIPTLIVFKQGKPVTNIIGFKPKEQLKKELESVLK